MLWYALSGAYMLPHAASCLKVLHVATATQPRLAHLVHLMRFLDSHLHLQQILEAMSPFDEITDTSLICQ